MELYVDPEGEVYTENAVSYQLETGAWTAHLWDDTADTLVVETNASDTLWLVSITEDELPPDAELHSSADDPPLEDASDG